MGKEVANGFQRRKCDVLSITNKKHPIQHIYFIHGQKLATKNDSKYPGVTISSNLSWSKHVNNISKKASSDMALLGRNIRSASQQAKNTAYKTFVRPTLEYASTVWDPQNDTDSNQQEMVQRRAARVTIAAQAVSPPCVRTLVGIPCSNAETRSAIQDVPHYSPTGRHPRRTTPLDNRTRGHDAHFRQTLTSFFGYQHSFIPRTSCGIDSRNPVNAGDLPDLAGRPHILNQPQMF